MKKRTAVVLVIIFAAAFLLGADLSFFDLHLYGKVRRVLNNILPENTSNVVPAIADPMNTPGEADGGLSNPDPFLDADASAYATDFDRAVAMFYEFNDQRINISQYAYRMQFYYSSIEDQKMLELMETQYAMMEFIDIILWEEGLALYDRYEDSKMVMDIIRYLRAYVSRTFMEIYMGEDITPELFEEYAEQYKTGVPLIEILE